MKDQQRLRLLEAALEQSYNAVVITTADLERPGPEIVYANRAFEEMTGYRRDELQGATPRLLQGPETSGRTIARMRRALAAGEPFEGNTVNYRKDGTPYHVEWSISPVRDDEGRVTHFVSVQRDITEELHNKQDRDLLSSALEESADQVLITDTDGHIVYVNPAFEEHTGYSSREVLGRNPRILKSGRHSREFYQRLWETLREGHTFRDTFTDRDKDGRLFYIEQAIRPVRDNRGRIIRYVSTGKDITERVEMEQELKRLATTDKLTGLMNRLKFEEILEGERERCRRYDRPLSLVMFDIDHFKGINDTFGHDVGDEVLARIAELVRRNLRDSDQVARWGGEEFMLLAPETELDGARRIAEKLRFAIASHVFPGVGHVTSSFGVTELQGDESVKRLIKRTDNHLYDAKEIGRDCVVAEG